VRADVITRETEVARRAFVVGIVDVDDVAGNLMVVANVAVRLAAEVARETLTARNELLVDDGLYFDFANLLGDDLLVPLPDNCEVLLNNFDGNGLADYVLLLDQFL